MSKSPTMQMAGLKAYITKLKKHHTMVVAGYKAHATMNGRQYRRLRSR